MSTTCRRMVERAVLVLLIDELKQKGWTATHIHDGDGWKAVAAAAQERRVFGLDECTLRFCKDDATHTVWLVQGNDGVDMISDWAYADGDPDGFNAAMEYVQLLIDTLPVRFVVKS